MKAFDIGSAPHELIGISSLIGCDIIQFIREKLQKTATQKITFNEIEIEPFRATAPHPAAPHIDQIFRKLFTQT